MDYRNIYTYVFGVWKNLKENGGGRFYPEIRAHAKTMTQLMEKMKSKPVVQCCRCGDSHGFLEFVGGEPKVLRCVECGRDVV